jgi:hypothetical protein
MSCNVFAAVTSALIVSVSEFAPAEIVVFPVILPIPLFWRNTCGTCPLVSVAAKVMRKLALLLAAYPVKVFTDCPTSELVITAVKPVAETPENVSYW